MHDSRDSWRLATSYLREFGFSAVALQNKSSTLSFFLVWWSNLVYLEVIAIVFIVFEKAHMQESQMVILIFIIII